MHTTNNHWRNLPKGNMMAGIDAEAYALLDDARNLLVEFKAKTTPDQTMDDGVPAWQLYFGFDLLIDKSHVMVNNRVADEMTEAHETLTRLVNDLTKLCN